MAVKTCITIFIIVKIVLIFTTLCSAIESERLPALYNFDNYRECIEHNNAEQTFPTKYCIVLVKIQPQNDSSMWQQITELNAIKFNYHHDTIFRGICMENCEGVPETQGNSESGLLVNEQTEIFRKLFNNTLDNTMRYDFHREIHECINREYLENYNFTTKTFVNYCEDPKVYKAKDIYFNLTILLLVIILLINILSSIYDAKLKPLLIKSNEKDNYYEVKHNEKVNRYLTAFSLYRNYKRLVEPNKSDIGIDLGFLDGFRSILCVLILLEHAILIQFIHIENIEFIETSYTQLWGRLIMHVVVWLELFFVLSGLLLYIKFEKVQYITRKSSLMDCVRVFTHLTLSRYLRYLPSLIFVIIVNANITYYNEHGPFTRYIVEPTCLPCREQWWQNILMITNYKMINACLMHTWYIAADFQLYAAFLLILIVIAKYPMSKTYVLCGVAVLAAAINFGVNYILKLDSIFTLLPESYRYYYLKDIDTAKYLYFTSYTNINSFLIGIVCGLIYMKYLRNNPENKIALSKILKYAPYIGWPCIVGILYLGTTIMEHKETTIWTASYGLLQRHVGLTIVAIIVIVRGLCNGGGIFKLPIFRFLSRISFQIYLWQIVVFINIFAYFEEPVHIGFSFMAEISTVAFVSITIISTVVALMVEYPFAEIINIIDIEKKIRPIKSS